MGPNLIPGIESDADRVAAVLHGILRRRTVKGGATLPSALVDEIVAILSVQCPSARPDLVVPAGKPHDASIAGLVRIYAQHVGSVSYARVTKAIRPMVTDHGIETVTRWWTCYCKNRPLLKRSGTIWGDDPGDGPQNKPPMDSRWTTPEDFARNLQMWRTLTDGAVVL